MKAIVGLAVNELIGPIEFGRRVDRNDDWPFEPWAHNVAPAMVIGRKAFGDASKTEAGDMAHVIADKIT